jgi:hypothetical protein
MRKFFIVLIVLLAGVLLVVEDHRMADRIARIKEAEVADYRLRLPKGGLDFNGPERQGCIMKMFITYIAIRHVSYLTNLKVMVRSSLSIYTINQLRFPVSMIGVRTPTISTNQL